jgi:dipeptidyl aminopeptidase/acylaminoacyl peptidase
VLLYDRHDIWEVSPDGSRALRLTDGRDDDVRYRYVRLDLEEEWIDRSAPLVVSQFGLRSKRSGYARVSAGPSPSVTSLVWLDKRVDRLARAKKAERFVYAVQAFDDSPDYFAAGPALGDATQVTATNPFMSEHAWGRAELVEYRSAAGTPLQGALYYPAGYEPGRRYPMVVYMYEKLSDGLHTFSVPSERSVYNAAAFTTRGYFYFMPDIVFRPGEPGVSVVEAVLPAVQQVVDSGVVDPARIGILGHSWGGFDSVYLATHTTTFAAAVAGAPITNLVSNYGNHHWTSGIAETDHIETGQQRMVVPLYEDLDAYIRNSGIFKVHEMTTPLLVMFGDNDGTVHWFQGVELYNVARRAGTPVVMLAYAGEDHGLRKRPNQIDYHHRIFEWFDHYLKGDSAERWIVEGERFLDREDDLQRRKKPAPPARTGTTTEPPSPQPGSGGGSYPDR